MRIASVRSTNSGLTACLNRRPLICSTRRAMRVTSAVVSEAVGGSAGCARGGRYGVWRSSTSASPITAITATATPRSNELSFSVSAQRLAHRVLELGRAERALQLCRDPAAPIDREQDGLVAGDRAAAPGAEPPRGDLRSHSLVRVVVLVDLHMDEVGPVSVLRL